MSGKHSLHKEENSKGNKFSKFLIILFLVILLLFTYFKFISKNINLSIPKIYNNIVEKMGNDPEEKPIASVDEPNKIENTKNLVNSKFKVLSGEFFSTNGFSNVKGTVENSSDDVQSNLNLVYTLFDSNEEIITEFNISILQLEPHSSSSFSSISMKNLSDVVSYSVRLVEN